MFDGDYVFRGKTATYAKFLAKNKGVEDEERANVFDKVIDVLLIAPLVGVAEGNYISEEEDPNSDKSTIQYATIHTNRNELKFVYRMVMLANPLSQNNEDKISQAFRHDMDSDSENPNMKIFNGYVRGGIEILYEQFKDAYTYKKQQDKKDYIAKRMVAFVDQYQSEINDLLDQSEPNEM